MTIRIPKRALGVLAGVLLLAGVAGAAYVFGQSTRDEQAAWTRGHVTGFRAGEKAAGEEAEELATDQYVAGMKEGRRQGREEGRREGRASGYNAGTTAGQNGAFEGYSGGWEVGRWYIVKVGTGRESGLSGKYSIPTRVGPMALDEAYELCEDNDVCTTTVRGQ